MAKKAYIIGFKSFNKGSLCVFIYLTKKEMLIKEQQLIESKYVKEDERGIDLSLPTLINVGRYCIEIKEFPVIVDDPDWIRDMTE